MSQIVVLVGSVRREGNTELLARGFPEERILKYGLAFRGKECLIRKG